MCLCIFCYLVLKSNTYNTISSSTDNGLKDSGYVFPTPAGHGSAKWAPVPIKLSRIIIHNQTLTTGLLLIL